jgi:hypothetical protein
VTEPLSPLDLLWSGIHTALTGGTPAAMVWFVGLLAAFFATGWLLLMLVDLMCAVWMVLESAWNRWRGEVEEPMDWEVDQPACPMPKPSPRVMMLQGCGGNCRQGRAVCTCARTT